HEPGDESEEGREPEEAEGVLEVREERLHERVSGAGRAAGARGAGALAERLPAFEERRGEEVGESAQPDPREAERPAAFGAEPVVEEVAEVVAEFAAEGARVERQETRVDPLRPGASRPGAHVGSRLWPRAFTDGEARSERRRRTSASTARRPSGVIRKYRRRSSSISLAGRWPDVATSPAPSSRRSVR